MSCGTAPAFHQREQLVERLKEGRLAGLRSPRVGCHHWEHCPFERASMASPSSSMMGSASSSSMTGRVVIRLRAAWVSTVSRRKREFRVVFHPSVHLSLGVCNGFIGFEGAVVCFLKDLKPFLIPSYMSPMLPKSVASCIFFQTRSRWRDVWQCFELHCV